MSGVLEFWNVVVGVICAGVVAAVFGIPIWQVWTWLKSAVWVPVSVLDVFAYLLGGDFAAWARYPVDWKGLNELLDFLHGSIGLGVVAFCLFWAYRWDE